MDILKQLSLSGKTTDGKTVSFPAPLELDYREDRYVPCSSLDFTLPLDGEESEFCEVAASLDGVPLFEGIVDRQISEKSGDGMLVRMECRSKTALLLDNEVKPSVYFQLTSSQLFDRYAAPNGVLGMKLPYQAKISYLQVNKGSSVWDVLQQFCQMTYNNQPFITRERQLVIDSATGVTRVLSNRIAGAMPYSKLTVRRKNDQFISRLYVKTATEASGSYYGIVYHNAEAINRQVQRERYYHPSSTTTASRRWEANLLLQRSNQNAFEVEVLIPGLHAAEPGDLVKLPEESLPENLHITGVRYRASDAGVTTTLLLQLR